MMEPRHNIHATAIVIGTTGLIFIGPSGAGKSSTAHACLADAERRGLFASLVADDQVFIRHLHGRLIAERPQTIANRMEIRGTGILALPSLTKAALHVAVQVDRLSAMDRLPVGNERFEALQGHFLPLVHLARETPEPFALLQRLIPFRGLSNGFGTKIHREYAY